MPSKTTRVMICILTIALIFLFPISQVLAEEKPEKKESKAQEPVIKHVFIITINGLGKEGYNKAFTPNINGLAASGVKTLGALSVLPSTGPAVMASVLTGAEPQSHGFYKKGDHPKIPTILTSYANYGRKVAFIDGSGLSKGLISEKYYRSAITDFSAHGDKGVMDQAIKEFKAEQPYFIALSLPGVDQAGHKDGLASNQYRQAVTKADEQIGRLLLVLQNYKVMENSLIVVTGDHGFTGKEHSKGEASFTEKEMVVPVIIKGPGFKPAMVIPPFRLVDITPTLAYITGLNPPKGATGTVIWNSLKNGRGYNQYSLMEKRISDLSNSLMSTYRNKYSLEERKRLVDEEKKTILKEKSRTQEIVNSKDKKIFKLIWQIRLMKLAGLITILTLGFGYVVEYFVLRKKFLMF